MKTHRSWWFAFVVLAACGSAPAIDLDSHLGGACTDSASVTRPELEAGGVLCEHQTLVAPIRPGDDLKVGFRVLTPGDVDLCFDDDDQEPHEASLRGTSVAARTPCQTVSLPAGDHVLGLRHAIREAGGEDARPDVLHTKWTPPTRTSRGRLQVTSNACRGCTLKGAWPELGVGFYGYAGDYTDAIIDGPCTSEPGRLPGVCQLGVSGMVSSFERAQIVIPPVSGTKYNAIGVDFCTFPDNPTACVTNLRRAKLTLRGPVYILGADASGAAFLGEGDLQQVESTNLTGVDLGDYRGTALEVADSRMDVVTYSALLGRSAEVSLAGVTVTIPKGQTLAGLIIDGNPRSSRQLSLVWPLDENGILAMPGMSFEKATLRNVTIPCPHGGNLRGASFAGATLENVSLTGCNLTDARFAGSTLTNVTAASKTLLIRADLTNVAVKGLNVSEASLSDATLKNAANSAWTGLVARHLTAGSLHAQGLVMGLDENGRGPDFSFALLPGADFSNAQLPRAVLAGATLTTTNFSGASLVGANFEASNGIGPNFEKAHLEPSTVSRTSLNQARFATPNFRGAFLQGAQLTFARVCGGDFEGVHLEGANLTQTLMPPVSDRFTKIGEDTFDCVEIKDLTTSVRDATDATTLCPNGAPGPCSDAAWVPSNFVPQCAAGLPRKKSGFPCTTACDCKLLTCLDGTCG